jgi:RNA polymerase sigma factor (sigma-70 family)
MYYAERTSLYEEHQFYTALRERIERLVRRYCLGLETEHEAVPYSTPEDDLLLYFVLQEAMQTLSESDRQTFELRYGVGLSYREIAQRVGSNTEAVRKRITRALARLKMHPSVHSILSEDN